MTNEISRAQEFADEDQSADDIDDLLNSITSSSSLEGMFDEFGGTAKNDQVLTDRLISRAFALSSPDSFPTSDSSTMTGPSLDWGSLGGFDDLLKSFRPSPSSSSSSSSASSPIAVPPLIQLSANANPTSTIGNLDNLDNACMCDYTTITTCSTSDQSLLTEESETRKATDKYYTRVLEAFLDQSKSVEDAYAENEAEKRGMSWRDLLDRNMDVHPLSDDQTKNPDDDAVDRSTVVPRLHYLPILLECAKVWRHALEEAIEQRGKRGSNEKEWFWEHKSLGEKFRGQDLLHPAERRHLAQQAGRIVQRYLCLLEILPSATSITESSGFGTYSWDDFSKSSIVTSANFLDFVYDEFLRPASDMGWEDLIRENVIDSPLAKHTSRAHAKKFRLSPVLLTPVIGALHTIIARAQNEDQPYAGFDPTTRALEWSRSNYAKLFYLGKASSSILQAKLDSLDRIIIKSWVGEDDEAYGGTYQKTYTPKETGSILLDCVEEWTSLAQHRHNAKSKSYRDRLATELTDIAINIVHHYKRLHKVETNAPTVKTITYMINFIYQKLLKPAYHLDLPNLASTCSTDIIGDQSLACILIDSIQTLHSTSASSLEVHRIEQKLHHGLRVIGICPLTCLLRSKLKTYEGCDSASIDSGEASDILGSCLALWKKAAGAVSEVGQRHGTLNIIDEGELIQLAGNIVLKYQCLHMTKAYGTDFYLSSVSETSHVLDFILDNFLCQVNVHSLNLGRKVPIYEPSSFARMGTAEATFSSFEFFEIIVGAIANLAEKGEDKLATKFYEKCCLAGGQDCNYKDILDSELAGMWPGQ